MIQRKHFWAALLTILLIGQLTRADEITTISLQPFVAEKPFADAKADWLLPQGRHVFDGVPWQINGCVVLHNRQSLQPKKPEPSKVDNIPVGKKFDRLHLLAAAQSYTQDTPTVAKIDLNYTDGTVATLDLIYGVNLGNLRGPWHKPEEPLKDQNVHQAWHAQCDVLAYNGSYLRMFHVPLTNPQPAKEVRSISLKLTREPVGLFVCGMSVGPSGATPLASESLGKAPFPDLRPRTGELCIGEGFVYDSNGKPLGDAVVKVILARKFVDYGPAETGVGIQTKTDSNGHFALPNLPDDCTYRLLILADNFAPFIYHGLDAKSDPIAVRLEPKKTNPGKYAARARITGVDGKPIAFAQVDREGVAADGGTSWGGPSGMPDTTVTDKNGEFVFAQNEPFTRVQVKVNAVGLAPLNKWIDVSDTTTNLQMTVGATIRGRVLDLNSKPLPNVEIGISGTERDAMIYAGHYTATTHADGIFEFEHVATNTTWELYGVVSSLKQFGALPARSVTSADNGETNQLGDLQIIKCIHLAGRVKTRGDEPLPKNLKVHLGIDRAWDYQTAQVDQNGAFSFDGLYPTKIDITLQNNKWRLAGLNRSMSFYNPDRLEGMLEKDKDDLVLLIEKGAREYNYDSGNGSLPPGDNPATKAIAGVENLEGAAIVLSGKVVDDETGQPIAKCKIVPGYQPSPTAYGIRAAQQQKNLMQKLLKPLATKRTSPWDIPFWMSSRSEQTTNGTFSISFVPLKSTPLLRVEAPGYLPVVTEPIAYSTNGLVVRLTHGEGPSGVVLLLDGEPAADAGVHYAGPREQFSLKDREIELYGGPNKKLFKTGADGSFKFPMLATEGKVFAAHPSGYAEQVVTGKNENLKLHLKPWATLIGTLIYSNGTPATNIDLDLQLYDGTTWNFNQPLANFQGRIKTDDKGNFVFSNVPPRRVHISRLVPVTSGPMAGRSWSYREQTWIDVEPGTNDIGKIIFDTPPAQPVVEQLKKKLGL